jgi:hypothetical protein
MAPLVAGRVTTLVAAAGAALVLAATPALAVVTASTDGFDTVSIESDAAADVVTMTCDADEANVNGTSALPALACDDVSTVLVDAADGANTVNLGGLTGVVAPLVGKQPEDIQLWLLEGEVPVVLRSDAQMFAEGPVWRIELLGPDVCPCKGNAPAAAKP